MEKDKTMTCYESRKAGKGYPACCKDKNCDEERKVKFIHECEMIQLPDGAWADNQSHNGKGVPDMRPLIQTPENVAEIKQMIAEGKRPYGELRGAWA